MTRRVLLVEIGTPAELPVVTPPAPRPPSSWVPDPRPSPGLPPPTGLAVVSIADAAVLTWTPSVAGGQTIIEAAPDVAGVPGIWREVDRTGADTYTISLPGGPRWVRVRAELNGRTSAAANAVLAEPVPVGDISEFEQELRDLQDLVDAVAAQAAADAAALNARADDLRDDIDGEITRALAAESALGDRADGLRSDVDEAIAEISTLGDTTEDLATEIARVEAESVGRDTATASTIALLGATNGAGTAFILDGNTVRVAPDQSLAQWRASVQGEFASQSSRIDTEVQTLQDADQALATTLAAVQATANNAATKAELTAAQSALASDIAAEASRIGAMEVRMPAGSDKLANEARVVAAENAAASANAATASTLALLGAKNAAGTAFILDGNTVRMSPTETLAQWRSSIQGNFQSQSSRIDNEVQARQTADAAHTAAIHAAQSTANNAATKAELTAAENTFAAANQALSERLSLTQASIHNETLAINPDFEMGGYGWQEDAYSTSSPDSPLPYNASITEDSSHVYTGARALRIAAPSSAHVSRVYNFVRFSIGPTERVHGSIRMRTWSGTRPPAGTRVYLGVRWYSATGSYVGDSALGDFTFDGNTAYYYSNSPLAGEAVAPAGTAFGRFVVHVSEHFYGASGSLFFDGLQYGRGGTRALASALELVRTNVSEIGGIVEAHSQTIQQQTADIQGKASTSYVQSVEGVATAAKAAADSAAGQASANLASINGLTATVGDQSASINEVREVAAQGASGNAVLDSSFETGVGWEVGAGANRQTSTNPATGEWILVLTAGAAATANAGRLRVDSVPRISFGAKMRRGLIPNSGATLNISINFYRANGGYISTQTLSVPASSLTASWQVFSTARNVPAEAHTARAFVTQSGLTSGQLVVDDVFLQAVSETLAGVLTSYVLAMNAAGKFAGVKYLNDGTVSNAQFLFDNFDFETADGSFRISDGRTITRSNGYMRVEGKPFGQNNEMVVWYGPEQSNLANCRRNNAISFETNNGLHYSIGAMFSGTISAGGYTTAIAATRYSTGAFGTNGGPIVVNASFTHSRQQLGGKRQAPNWQKNTISAGSGTTSATIELWRRIGTGSWQLVASATREGVLTIDSFPGEPDVDDVAQWNNTVSLTYTDNAGGTQNREFEVRLIQNTFQGIVISGDAPVPAPTDSRSLGVRTSE